MDIAQPSRIQRTFHALASLVQDMRVDHGRTDVFMTQQFLNRSYIVARFQQMGREGMAERMARGPFAQAGTGDGSGDRAADGAFVGMVATSLTGTRIDRDRKSTRLNSSH